MKKWLSLFLAVALLVTAAFALAEEFADPAAQENQSETLIYSSSIQFGADINTASASYLNYWIAGGFNLNKNAEQKYVTLSDGSKYLEQTYLPADELYEGNEMTGKLYFLNGAAVAGVEDFTIPEGRDASAFINQVSSFLGASLPLDLDSLGTVAELIGETAHLADGQPVWENKSLIQLPSMDQSAEVTIYVTVGTTDNHVYLAEWPADNSSESSGSTQDFSNLDGFNELTREEKNMVSFYADFLEKQMKNQLQQYIDFLKEKHASD